MVQMARSTKRRHSTKRFARRPWHIVKKIHTSGAGVRFVTMLCGARSPEAQVLELDDLAQDSVICELCTKRLVDIQS